MICSEMMISCDSYQQYFALASKCYDNRPITTPLEPNKANKCRKNTQPNYCMTKLPGSLLLIMTPCSLLPTPVCAVQNIFVQFNLLMSKNMSKASSSVLLLQKATNKRQQQMLKDAFRMADKNGDGKLSYDEYWQVVKKSNIK